MRVKFFKKKKRKRYNKKRQRKRQKGKGWAPWEDFKNTWKSAFGG